MKTTYKANELPSLTAEQKENLKRVAALSDSDIDLSDIPEVTEWSGAIRGSLVSIDSNTGQTKAPKKPL